VHGGLLSAGGRAAGQSARQGPDCGRGPLVSCRRQCTDAVTGKHCVVAGKQCAVAGKQCAVAGKHCAVAGKHCAVARKHCAVAHAGASVGRLPCLVGSLAHWLVLGCALVQNYFPVPWADILCLLYKNTSLCPVQTSYASCTKMLPCALCRHPMPLVQKYFLVPCADILCPELSPELFVPWPAMQLPSGPTQFYREHPSMPVKADTHIHTERSL